MTSISSKNLKNTRKCMLPNSTKYAKRKGFGKFGCLMIKNDRNGLRVMVIGLSILGFGYGNISPSNIVRKIGLDWIFLWFIRNNV